MYKSIFRKIFRMWLAAIVLATSLLTFSAFAIDSNMQMTGAYFSDACTRADESWVSFCNGYIQAVIDSIHKEDIVCLPDGTTRTELVTIAEREITSSHQLQEMNAYDAVKTVIRNLYPCQ
jgi:uncharacterized protein YqfB (UPF0267 family)